MIPAEGVPPLPEFEDALAALLPRLVAWAHMRLRGAPGSDAEDLAQEVLCRALLRRDSYRGGHLAAWVFQIAKLTLLEQLRHRRRAQRIRLGEGHGSQFDLDACVGRLTTLTRVVARRDDLAKLLQYAQQLDALDRMVLMLCGLEGLSPREAMVHTGLGEEATAKRYYRLRQRLRVGVGGALWADAGGEPEQGPDA